MRHVLVTLRFLRVGAGQRLAGPPTPDPRQAAFQVSRGAGRISGSKLMWWWAKSVPSRSSDGGHVSPWLRAALSPFHVGPPTATCSVSRCLHF